MNRRLDRIGGERNGDGDPQKVFGFDSFEGFGEPLDGAFVPVEFNLFESCGIGEVKRKRCSRSA